ncbi:hypothetical protein OJF2_58920 [Aquisphaera giovannonii]|uniref:Uncharacterized protein n=1 Tax=Aquisphaera giovannonii TaxID=406548 RepID=A0A5B9W9P8_9BACT|nr:hypothetical protein [Aquisphaera giovannonii]QEH37302.1 hypothetical protein OJF2_58920 [Aquisphaera giovannonii]
MPLALSVPIISIRANDALACAHANHVAVIHSVDAHWVQHFANKAHASTFLGMHVVVDSNGAKGLSNSTYIVKSVDANGVFKVECT